MRLTMPRAASFFHFYAHKKVDFCIFMHIKMQIHPLFWTLVFLKRAFAVSKAPLSRAFVTENEGSPEGVPPSILNLEVALSDPGR